MTRNKPNDCRVEGSYLVERTYDGKLLKAVKLSNIISVSRDDYYCEFAKTLKARTCVGATTTTEVGASFSIDAEDLLSLLTILNQES